MNVEQDCQQHVVRGSGTLYGFRVDQVDVINESKTTNSICSVYTDSGSMYDAKTRILTTLQPQEVAITGSGSGMDSGSGVSSHKQVVRLPTAVAQAVGMEWTWTAEVV